MGNCWTIVPDGRYIGSRVYEKENVYNGLLDVDVRFGVKTSHELTMHRPPPDQTSSYNRS